MAAQSAHGAVTPDKDLRAGNSVWHRSSGTLLKVRTLQSSIKVDIAIVGAGISGAFMAHALAPRYDRVVIVDRRAPIQGATSASTAMLQFEIDQPLTKLAKKIGLPKAVNAWQGSFKATQDLVNLVRREGIRCGLERRESLYVTGNNLGPRALQLESRARNRAGIPGDFLDKSALRELFGIDRAGAILCPKAAIANPVQLAAGLLRRAVEHGAEIYSPVNIQGVLATPHGVVLDTGRHFIEAKQVIFCTGYEVLQGLPTKGTKITSSWAIASKTRTHYPPWLDKVVVWEAATPYLYLRTTPNGRVIAGGEDEDIDLPSYRIRSLERKSARLAAKVGELIPGLTLSPSHKWTGAFGESLDGLPVIDAVPDMAGCFVVMGFGGNGTIYSMIASQIMPFLLHGRANRDTALYRFRD